MKSAEKSWPWTPVKLDQAAVLAIKALASGTASAGQQQQAMGFILHGVCEVDRLSFWPGGEDGRRATDFSEGKRFVGIQIRRILNMKAVGVDSRGPPPPMPGEPEE